MKGVLKILYIDTYKLVFSNSSLQQTLFAYVSNKTNTNIFHSC